MFSAEAAMESALQLYRNQAADHMLLIGLSDACHWNSYSPHAGFAFMIIVPGGPRPQKTRDFTKLSREGTQPEKSR